MDDGLTEDDLLGGSPREPLRTCCLKLAEKLWALVYNATPWLNAAAIRLAVQEVQQSANTDAAAKGNLDTALVQLVRAVDSNNIDTHPAVSMSRLDAVEMLAGVVQAAVMAGLGGRFSSRDEEKDLDNKMNSDTNRQQQETEIAEEEMEDDPSTNEISSLLQSIALLLDINPRQPSATPVAEEIQKQVEMLTSSLPSGFFNAIVPPSTLSDTQYSILKDVDTALHAENALRRKMLIERIKVTLQSFMWSKRLIDDAEEENVDLKTTAEGTVASALSGMSAMPAVSVEDVFSATLGDVMTVTERATSASGPGALRAKVKDVLIGSVPDRGGRTDGKRKVAMPVWSERKVTSGGGGRGGRGGGGGRGQGGGQKKKQKT